MNIHVSAAPTVLFLVVALSACSSDHQPVHVDADASTVGTSIDAGTVSSSTSAEPPGDADVAEDADTREDSDVPDTGTSVTPSIDAGVTSDAGVSSSKRALTINEVVASNEGAWIDGTGETDDWVELVNSSARKLVLSDFTIEDANGDAVVLPELTLDRDERIVLWFDDEDSQGVTHLPFKLSSAGDAIVVRDRDGEMVDMVRFETLLDNEAYMRLPDVIGAFEICRYPSPERANGDECSPPDPPSLPSSVEFAPYAFPADFAEPTGPLIITELALRPAAFVELVNTGTSPERLSNYVLRISPHGPGLPWPTLEDGASITLPDIELAPRARVTVQLEAGVTSELESDPKFEGVVTLYDSRSDAAVERVDFMQWPVNTSLARIPEETGAFRFCINTTPDQENTCDELPSRDVGDRIRHLRTPGDYTALANGDTQLGIQGVKFVYDLQAGGVVHLLSNARWPLHYTFIREEIYLDPPLDRCDAEQRAEFDDGWYAFSVTEYFAIEGRSFLLGTLSHHSNNDLNAVEFAVGDVIVGEQMKEAFFAVVPHTRNPTAWAVRPQAPDQVERALAVEGELPLVSPEAPFENLTFQALTEGIAYGTLKFVPAAQLHSERLGPNVIVITDDVPNDIPLVGGLITEAFQTPLAHVNVLSQNRGTPNAALKNARTALAEHLDKLVRVEVNAGGLHVGEAAPEEAQAYWDSFVPAAANVSPRLDESVRGVQPLAEHSLDSLPAIGAKASQLAELYRVDVVVNNCPSTTVPLSLPQDSFAIPVVHSREHLEASGAKAMLVAFEQDEDFKSDPIIRAEALQQVQQAILDYPVDSTLLAEVEQAVFDRWGNDRVRLRSSSNTEDLPNFTGAGLYTSVAAYWADNDAGIEDGIRIVWASLWNARAYDERRFAGIAPDNIGMGVMVHPAYQSEEANGVVLTRDVTDLSRGDVYYINAQAGEASVTNPAPGVTTDQLIYRWFRTPVVMYQSESSLLPALDIELEHVLTQSEAKNLACAMASIHAWFKPLLDPDDDNPYFTMESEFKLVGPSRMLMIKQARPHTFGSAESIGDCREL
jgi:hypothetical protein